MSNLQTSIINCPACGCQGCPWICQNADPPQPLPAIGGGAWTVKFAGLQIPADQCLSGGPPGGSIRRLTAAGQFGDAEFCIRVFRVTGTSDGTDALGSHHLSVNSELRNYSGWTCSGPTSPYTTTQASVHLYHRRKPGVPGGRQVRVLFVPLIAYWDFFESGWLDLVQVPSSECPFQAAGLRLQAVGSNQVVHPNTGLPLYGGTVTVAVCCPPAGEDELEGIGEEYD